MSESLEVVSVEADRGTNLVKVVAEGHRFGVSLSKPRITEITIWMIAQSAPRVGEKLTIEASIQGEVK